MRSLLFDAGIDAHARHFLSRELVRVFAPKSTDMCQQNADGELLPFVLVGWDRMDAVAFPGKVPRCLRVHIFEADPHQHRLWGQSDKYRFTRAELQRHIRWEGVGVGSYELQRTSYGWHRGVVQSSVVPASERLAGQRVFMASIDTQGSELEVLRGLEGTVNGSGVDVILVEVMGSTPTVPAMLTWLSAHDYVLFDFLSVRLCEGQRAEPCSEASRKLKTWGVMDDGFYATTRPAGQLGITAWWRWFSSQEGPAIQTDVLAVRSDVLQQRPKLLNMLSGLCRDKNEPDGISRMCPYLKNRGKDPHELAAGGLHAMQYPECADQKEPAPAGVAMPHVYQAFRCIDRRAIAKPASYSLLRSGLRAPGPGVPRGVLHTPSAASHQAMLIACAIERCESAECADALLMKPAFASAVAKLRQKRNLAIRSPSGQAHLLDLLGRAVCNPFFTKGQHTCVHQAAHCILRGALGRLAPNLKGLMLAAPAKTVDTRLVLGLTNLLELRLDCGAQLEHLPRQLLSNMSNLRRFYAGHNQLRSLPPNLFAGAPNLEWLHLAVNRFARLPPGIFQPLTRLRSLYLGSGKDVVWPRGAANTLLKPFLQRQQRVVFGLPGAWLHPAWMQERCRVGSHFEGKVWVRCSFCNGADQDEICRLDKQPAVPGSVEYETALQKTGLA